MTGRAFQPIPLICTVILAFVLWWWTFYLSLSVFWLKISISAAVLAALSMWLQPPRREHYKIDQKTILAGLLSAIALYVVFWLGRLISKALLPFAAGQIGGIYGKGEGTSVAIIALLLFFVTGPCEEIYWRGYLQRNLADRFGRWQGWLLATVIYAAVHIWSLNFMLIGAAAVAGAFWGALFRYYKNLVPVIISHSIWSTVIFAFFPMH